MILDFHSTARSKEIAKKYQYDEFIIRRWLHFFGEEAIKIVEAFEKGIPKYIRVNTLKISEKELIERLKNRGFGLKKTEVPFCYEVVEEKYSIGATPEYLMGYYYVMDKSSCIPPLALEPKPNELVVDLSASPGGKTTFLAMLMKNKGVILAIEPQRERLQPLIDNVNRMGAMNVAILNIDGRDFPKLGIKADKILLDAPCTGEGIIFKDESRKTDRGIEDIKFCSSLQKELIISAFDSLKPEGLLVYSTCSLTPEENEFVVEHLLEKRNAELINIEYGEKALNLTKKDLSKAKRLYPHKHRCAGFFVAKIMKMD
ncbi:MAG: NOL1/NOP2/sun family putative RNA methylase [Archaeoglobaceae archaeon]|nr:NOL1/NOP2/sun family putative RNA methylase [Archaeoglobaceae archaeon]MDW8118151.1 NOL1/NOP2/sun family putative RNA methylase [Archaeoglobaceae archaeon]